MQNYQHFSEEGHTPDLSSREGHTRPPWFRQYAPPPYNSCFQQLYCLLTLIILYNWQVTICPFLQQRQTTAESMSYLWWEHRAAMMSRQVVLDLLRHCSHTPTDLQRSPSTDLPKTSTHTDSCTAVQLTSIFHIHCISALQRCASLHKNKVNRKALHLCQAWAAVLNFVVSCISFQNYFCEIAKSDILNYLTKIRLLFREMTWVSRTNTPTKKCCISPFRLVDVMTVWQHPVVKVDHETRRYSCSIIYRTQSIRMWKPPTRADDQPERLHNQPVLRTGYCRPTFTTDSTLPPGGCYDSLTASLNISLVQ